MRTEAVGVNIYYNKQTKVFYQSTSLYYFYPKSDMAGDFKLSFTTVSEHDANTVIEQLKLTKSEDDKYINYDHKLKLKMLAIYKKNLQRLNEKQVAA